MKAEVGQTSRHWASKVPSLQRAGGDSVHRKKKLGLFLPPEKKEGVGGKNDTNSFGKKTKKNSNINGKG